MAIYRHFPSKEALLRGVAEAFYAELEIDPGRELPWRERIRRSASSLRRAILRHPNLISLLLHTPPVMTTDWLMSMEVQLAAFREAGLDPESALQAYYTLGAYVFGYVTVELQYARSPIGEDDVERVAAMLESGRFPATRDSMPYFAGDWDELFDVGLDTTLAGVVARYGAG